MVWYLAYVLIKVSRGTEPVEHMHMGEGSISLSDGLTQFSVESPTMAVCMLESHSCTVHEAGCLSSPNLALTAQRIPGELWVFSPKNLDSSVPMSAAGGAGKMHLPTESEGRQAEEQL